MDKPTEPQRKALGKGLSALLPPRGAGKPQNYEVRTPAAPVAEAGVAQISIDLIDANPMQPRTVFEPDSLAELAQSIRTNGIIQPLIVQRNDERYQLVAGERRWRAARIAGLAKVPVVVREFATDRLLEVALIENIQREDLNPIEVAQALDRLSRDLKLSHEEIGQRTGKDRSTVTNLLRLLKLPPEIQLLVAERRLSMGHARALVGLPMEEMQVAVAEKAAAQGMSVRQLERHIQELVGREVVRKSETAEPAPVDPNVTAAMREMESALGTKVRIISQSKDRGRIEIEYYSAEDLDRIYDLIVNPTPK